MDTAIKTINNGDTGTQEAGGYNLSCSIHLEAGTKFGQVLTIVGSISLNGKCTYWASSYSANAGTNTTRPKAACLNLAYQHIDQGGKLTYIII
jgi:hypothetical protein